jgi:hypothetical protein
VAEERLVTAALEPAMRHNLGTARLDRPLEEGRQADADELLARLAREVPITTGIERRNEG